MSLPAEMPPTLALEIRQLSKAFGHVDALREIDLEVRRGEVLALVGDNGAGKSTLIKVLSGIYAADSGAMKVGGNDYEAGSPTEARVKGITTVFQDLALVDVMDVASNIFLGHEPKKFGVFVDKGRMYADARTVLSVLRSDIPSVKVRVKDLSGGQRQAVAIARSIAQRCQVLLLDEPTAALGVEQQAKVTQLIASLREVGTTVVLISHNMEHVFEVADRIAVMRRGQMVGVRSLDKTSRSEIVSMITGMQRGDREVGRAVSSSPELLGWLESRDPEGQPSAESVKTPTS